ncbi:MAG: PIN domain-containing protein [Desulfamplus sp.]|nr:PIN domain-containing protein [Desulfamplus sp.]
MEIKRIKTTLRTVPDTNIIIAAQSKNPKSPNREYYECWLNHEFELLYSEDTMFEYALKLNALGMPETDIREFILEISKLGIQIQIEFFHLRVYPEDFDDVAFVLCAENGNATHLISYDKHILDLKYRHKFDFKICKIIEFLQELRN